MNIDFLRLYTLYGGYVSIIIKSQTLHLKRCFNRFKYTAISWNLKKVIHDKRFPCLCIRFGFV